MSLHSIVTVPPGDAEIDVIMKAGKEAPRSLFLWAARQYSGMTLSAIGEHCDSMTFSAVSAAVKRFELAAVKERNAKAYKRKLCSILNVEP